jgi:hypothetical protein
MTCVGFGRELVAKTELPLDHHQIADHRRGREGARATYTPRLLASLAGVFVEGNA